MSPSKLLSVREAESSERVWLLGRSQALAEKAVLVARSQRVLEVQTGGARSECLRQVLL